jgi:uncharacterized membrane protein YheB (UPF0754 family)
VIWQALITVLFGALAGGVTNSLAIWMLFHPYEPPRLFGRKIRLLQGAIPKNRARLASAIGRTVGTRLLTPEDLGRIVAEPAFRTAFDDRLADFLARILEQERGSLSEILPDTVAAELRALLGQAGAGLVDRLDAYLSDDEFRQAAIRWANALAEDIRDQPIGEVLTPEREQALTTAAERWIGDAVGGKGFARAVDDYLGRTTTNLLRPGRTFEELLPAGLVAAFERAVAGYLPLALERLGGLLEEPAARQRLEAVLHEILDRFMRDLKFHQRIVAAFVIPPDVVNRVLLAIEAEGANKLAELLHDPEVRDAMARNVNDAVVDFLRRPVTSVLGEPGDPSVEEARETVAGWALNLARDAQTHAFLVEKLQTTLRAAERRTWGDLFRHVPPEKIADAVVAAARSERARGLYREAADRLVTLAMEKRIGRPADHLPADAVRRIERVIADPLWSWLQDQVPNLAQKVDIAQRVEQKVLDFPMSRIEELIRSVTERELHLIVRLGYILGAVIGTGLVAINALFP